MSTFYKYFPSRALSLIACIPDGTMRGEFLLLIHLCLEHGPLPYDSKKIALRSAISIDRVEALRPYLDEFSTVENGVLMINFAAELLAERERFGELCSTNAKKSHENRSNRARQSQAEPGNAGHTSDNAKDSGGQNGDQSNGQGSDCYQTQASQSQAKPGIAGQIEEEPGNAIHTYIHDKHDSHTSSRRGDNGGGIVVELADEIKARRLMMEEAERESGPLDLEGAVRQVLCLPPAIGTATTTRKGKVDQIVEGIVELAARSVSADQVVRFAEWWKKINPRKPLNLYFLRKDIWTWIEQDQQGGSSYTNGQSETDHRELREPRVNSSRNAARSTVARWGANASGLAGGAD